MNAGMAITAAEPSGLWGLLKESFAGSSELAHAAADPNANPLVKAVVSDFMTGEGRSVARDGLKAEFANSKPAEIKTKAIDSLHQVASVLDAKAPGDAAAFKQWLRQIGQKTFFRSRNVIFHLPTRPSRGMNSVAQLTLVWLTVVIWIASPIEPFVEAAAPPRKLAGKCAGPLHSDVDHILLMPKLLITAELDVQGIVRLGDHERPLAERLLDLAA